MGRTSYYDNNTLHVEAYASKSQARILTTAPMTFKKTPMLCCEFVIDKFSFHEIDI